MKLEEVSKKGAEVIPKIATTEQIIALGARQIKKVGDIRAYIDKEMRIVVAFKRVRKGVYERFFVGTNGYD